MYIQFINTHFMGGGKTYLAPPHIFERGGPIPPAPPVPTHLTVAHIEKLVVLIL